MKIVFFNAPKEAGKDVAVSHLSRVLDSESFMLKSELYRAVADHYFLPVDAVIELATNRKTKETPNALFNGKSPRQALIHVSEDIIKPLFGGSYFGEMLVRSLELSSKDIALVSDGGFIDELKPVLEKYGAENIHVVRIHRKGYTFAGDSRSYMPDNVLGCNTHDIINYMPAEDNDLEFEEFKINVEQKVRGFL